MKELYLGRYIITNPSSIGFQIKLVLSGNDRNRDPKTNNNFRNKGEYYD